MKRYEQLTKKQLISLINTIRPKADAYDRVCQTLGIEKNILDYVRRLKANAPVVCSACGKPKDHYRHIKLGADLDNPTKHEFTQNAEAHASATKEPIA